MKSYTDLDQSKKLAEILPIESADMEYMFLKKDGSKISNVPFVKDGFEEPDCCYIFIHCWSLAALLDILPEIKDGKPIIVLDDNYITYPLINDLHTKSDNDNLIDACVEMILKLHKQNLL